MASKNNIRAPDPISRREKIQAFLIAQKKFLPVFVVVFLLAAIMSFVDAFTGPIENLDITATFKDGQSRKYRDFVYGDNGYDDSEFFVEGEFHQGFGQSKKFIFMIDDCLNGLTINNQNVPLSHLNDMERCDVFHGVTLDLSSYVNLGTNHFKAKVKNNRGAWMFSIHRYHSMGDKGFALFMISIAMLLVFALIEMKWQIFLLPEESVRRVVLSFVICVSFYLYLIHISDPALPIWDENYYITFTQKYLTGLFFMHIHPPLGKLVMALSEKLFGTGRILPIMLQLDYLKDFPPDFDYTGYRVLPSVFAAGAAIVFYLMCLRLTKKVWIALPFFIIYICENSMALHFRAGMFDGIFQFFLFLTMYAFFSVDKNNSKLKKILFDVLFVLGIGGIITTKVSGIIVIPLFPIYLWLRGGELKEKIKAMLVLGGSITVIYFGIWTIHVFMFDHTEPKLQNFGLYRSTIPPFESGFSAYLTHMKDQITFFFDDNAGVPKLDFRKPDENGSPPILWPIGGKGINYRWDRVGPVASYLQLQVNPMCYFVGLLGLILGFAYAMSPVFRRMDKGWQAAVMEDFNFYIILGLYVIYMTLTMFAGRVLFLYSYIHPWVFSVMLFMLLLPHFKWSERKQYYVSWILAFFCVSLFYYYAPFSFHWPILNFEVDNRAWIPHWDLHCWNCQRVFPWIGN